MRQKLRQACFLVRLLYIHIRNPIRLVSPSDPKSEKSTS